MNWKVFTLINMVWCVTARPPHATSEQKFIQYFKEKMVGSEAPENHEKYDETYPSYEFSYKILDPHTHDFKGQEEIRHGDKVNGNYWLVEPDGRKRIVKYHANDKIGFNVLIDYLQKEQTHPTPLKDQESNEMSSEENNEKDTGDGSQQDNGEGSQQDTGEGSKKDMRKYWHITKTTGSNDDENSEEDIDPKQLQETEGLNEESTLGEMTTTSTNEQKSRVEISNAVSDRKVKKIMRHRPQTWKNEHLSSSGNDQNGESQESILYKKNNGESSNERGKELEKRKFTHYHERQEKQTDESNLNEQNKETENVSELKNYRDHAEKSTAYWSHKDEKVKSVNKGYEVNEEIVENIDENNTEQRNDQIKEPESEEKSTGQNVISNSDIETSENVTNNKSVISENKDNKEEIYGYNTFIYHKRKRNQ